ncbi:MAG: cohesin domain-containing protein [Balneolaceae bacterium]
MRRTIKHFCLVLIGVLVSIPVLAQIQFSIPDTNAVDGDTLLIPVNVDSSLTGSNVLSFQLQLNYSNYLLIPLSVETEGTLVEGWNISTNLNTDNVIRIAGAGEVALSGTGSFLFIRFKLIRSGGTYLNFDANNTLLNEGELPLIFDSGYIGIADKPQIIVSHSTSQMVIGDSVQYSVSYAEAPVSWSTTNPDVGTMSQDGLLKAVGYGNVAVIAEDSRGIIDTSNVVKVYGFRLMGQDTTNYPGQMVSVDIHTTDLSELGIQSGSFYLHSQFDGRMEVQSVEAGPLLADDVYINSNTEATGISIAFAQTKNIAGAGHLLTLHMKLNETTTFYNTLYFQDILFNESIEGLAQNFQVISQTLPSLYINPYSGSYLVGDSIQFNVSNNTGWVDWEVTNAEAATIDDNGLLIAQKGGVTKVTAVDSIGATATTSDFTFYDVEMIFPDSSMLIGDTLIYPVRIKNVERSGATLYSSDIEFNYDHNRLDYLGFTAEGSLSEDWFYSENILSQNSVKLVGAGSDGFSTSGDFVYLKFKTDTSISTDSYTNVYFNTVLLNEGSPNSKNDNGSIFISTKPLTPVLVSPANSAQNISISPTLDWDPSVGADYYEVQLSTSTSFSVNLVDTTGVLTDELAISGLNENTVYYWRVRAVNDGGSSNWSPYFNFKTQMPIPAAPVLNNPADGAVDMPLSATSVSWNSSTYATGYRVEVDTNSSFSTIFLDSTLAGDTYTLLLPELDYNITYYWRVFASNSTGESLPSDFRSFTTITISETPGIPILLEPEHLFADADTALTFVWSNTAHADSFTIQLSTETSFASIVFEESLDDTTLYIHGLNYLTEYHWKVQATNTSGAGEWSEVFSFTTKEKVNMPAVVVQPLGEIILDEDFGEFIVAALELIFSDPEGGMLTYEIVDYDSLLFTASLNADTLVLTSLQDVFGVGELIVKATDDGLLETLDTLLVDISTINDLPVFVDVPDTIRFRNDLEFIFRLDTLVSDVEDDIMGLMVELITDPDDVTATYDEENFTITLSASAYTGESTLTVVVTDSDGGEALAAIIIVVEMSTSNELAGEIPDHFDLLQNYPNPFNPVTQIRFDLPQAADVKIEVYSMLGQKVATLTDMRYAAGKHKVQFEAGALSSGMYIYRIKAGDFVKSKKLTLIK